MKRYTFVVHAYPGAPSMLENLSTHERIRIPDLAAVGPQIECWLASLAPSGGSGHAATEPVGATERDPCDPPKDIGGR